MIYAVIDTNVIVSAYITKNLRAATSKVWEAVLQGKIRYRAIRRGTHGSQTNLRIRE